MIYSCGWPIWHTFNTAGAETIDYKIMLAQEVIFEGLLLPYDPAASTLEVDISDIVREYLEPQYAQLLTGETFIGYSPATILSFVVSSDYNTGGADVTYRVCYNYNQEGVSELPDSATISRPTLMDADPRQYFFISGYGTSYSYRYRVNGGDWTSKYILNTNYYHLLGVRMDDLVAGDTVELQKGTTEEPLLFTVVAPCRNRYALYYVNRAGGLDALLCSGRAVRTPSSTVTDVKLYNDRREFRLWETKRIDQQIKTTYELNTRLLRDSEVEGIEQLVFSPKVWIHDLQKDVIKSVVVQDKSYTERNYRTDDMFGYTITVAESHEGLIK